MIKTAGPNHPSQNFLIKTTKSNLLTAQRQQIRSPKPSSAVAASKGTYQNQFSQLTHNLLEKINLNKVAHLLYTIYYQPSLPYQLNMAQLEDPSFTSIDLLEQAIGSLKCPWSWPHEMVELAQWRNKVLKTIQDLKKFLKKQEIDVQHKDKRYLASYISNTRQQLIEDLFELPALLLSCKEKDAYKNIHTVICCFRETYKILGQIEEADSQNKLSRSP